MRSKPLSKKYIIILFSKYHKNTKIFIKHFYQKTLEFKPSVLLSQKPWNSNQVLFFSLKPWNSNHVSFITSNIFLNKPWILNQVSASYFIIKIQINLNHLDFLSQIKNKSNSHFSCYL